jgi:hypothetical protein
MSRPRSIQPSRIETAITLLAVGYTRRAAARHLGVPETTLRRALSDPEIAQRVAQARSLVEFDALKKIRRSMSHSWRAGRWYLERTNPWEFRAVKAAEVADLPDDDDEANLNPHPEDDQQSPPLTPQEALRRLRELDRCSPLTHRPLHDDVLHDEPPDDDPSTPNHQTTP